MLFKDFFLAYALSNEQDYTIDELVEAWSKTLAKDPHKLVSVRRAQYGDLVFYADGSVGFYLVTTGDGFHSAYTGVGWGVHFRDKDIQRVIRYK